MVKHCPVKKCCKCGGPNDITDCTVPRKDLKCTQCDHRNHTTHGHIVWNPGNKAKKNKTMVYTLAFQRQPRSWMVQFLLVMQVKFIHWLSKNFNWHGALVLYGIAISEQFFCQHLRGNLNKVSPLNTMMQSVGEVKIRILEQVKREPLSSWLGQLTTWPFQGNKCFCSSQPCWSHQYPTSQQV